MGDVRFSLCMIVKNEEAVLKDCLDSLQALMDEIIIVDTGSTDRTKEIAAQYTMVSLQPEMFPFPRQQGIISILRTQMNT